MYLKAACRQKYFKCQENPYIWLALTLQFFANEELANSLWCVCVCIMTNVWHSEYQGPDYIREQIHRDHLF